MSIKIHHGPNGSYKSAGAVFDDMIPAWKEGRTIVTNCRGVSAERFAEVLGVSVEEGGEVINVGTDTAEGRFKMATWFHWAPSGALVFVDEAQAIWPKAWTTRDLAQLDYPGGPEQAEKDGRPHCVTIAWEMHRHWNWDFVLTTPNINKIREEFRGCADGAFKHKNLALLGLRGRYIEGFHSPDDNGKSQSDFVSIRRRKVPSYVFKCYDSTKTGKHSDTISGSPLWQNPRILLLVSCLVGLGVWVSSRPVPAVVAHAADKVGVASSKPDQVASSDKARANDPVADRSNVSRDDGFRLGPQAVSLNDPFAGGVVIVGGVISMGGRTEHLLIYRHAQGDATLTRDDILKLGYDVQVISDCVLQLKPSADLVGVPMRTAFCTDRINAAYSGR